jgi:hypothetical protein
MRNKRPHLSREGYIGMGPVNTAPIDVVVVLVSWVPSFLLSCVQRKTPGISSFLEKHIVTVSWTEKLRRN